MKNIILIYNPKAGDTTFRFSLDRFIEIFSEKDYEVRVFRSRMPGDMATFLEQTDFHDTEAVMVAGGTGTINEVVGAMIRQKIDLPVGIVPAGTENEYARYLGFNGELEDNLKALFAMTEITVDVGRVGDSYFVDSLCVGTLSTISAVSSEMRNAFGKMANPLHAAARAVAKIADFKVPENPRTTFCVSNFDAGNDAGIHAIVPEATIKFNFRSNSEEELMKLKKRIFDAIQEACDEETARWGKDTITWDCQQFCDIHAGNQDIHAPIVQAAYLAARQFSEDPEKVYFAQGGSVNGNRSVARGIPAVTLGGGLTDTKCHNLDEYYPMKGSYRCPQEVLMMILMTAGIEGGPESVL